LGDLGENARVDEESSSYRVAKVPLGGFRGETVEGCKFPGIRYSYCPPWGIQGWCFINRRAVSFETAPQIMKSSKY
jgi:hypothetical protein